MNSMNWTKNEEDVMNFASLISHKMFANQTKVPNYIKAYMAQYYHYNFGVHNFDNLCWLTIHNILILVFEELKIKHIKSELCEDFAVRGAHLYKLWYSCGDIKFYHYDVSTFAYGFQPLDSFTRAIVARNATTGCSYCAYSGKNCSYCADGKLASVIAQYSKDKEKHDVLPDFYFCNEGWNNLSDIIGHKRMAALDDLSKAKLGEFLEDEKLERYLMTSNYDELEVACDDEDEDDEE